MKAARISFSVMMGIGPYGQLLPVSCSHAAAQQPALGAVCQTVTASVAIH